MKPKKTNRMIALALAFVLIGAFCIPCGARCGHDTVTVEHIREGKLSRTMYRPDVSYVRLVPGAAILGNTADGGAALALELARRGVTVALCGDIPSLKAAWNALAEEEHTSVAAMGLILIGKGAEEAFSYAEELVGSGRECAGVCLLSDKVGTECAETSPVRNVLLITSLAGDVPIHGYFSDGSARRVVSCRFALSLRADTRENLLILIDWLGSTLGHSIGLDDADLTVAPRRILLAVGTASILSGLALGALGIFRRKHTSDSSEKE